MPLLAGVIAYGVVPDPVAVQSCRLGKLAGVAQAVMLWVALAGRRQPPTGRP
jgi:hypothetical protein